MTDVRPDPFEPPGGQDDPPDLRQALLVVLVVLNDLRDRILRADSDPDTDADLVLRILAIAAVLRRIRQRLDDDDEEV